MQGQNEPKFTKEQLENDLREFFKKTDRENRSRAIKAGLKRRAQRIKESLETNNSSDSNAVHQ